MKAGTLASLFSAVLSALTAAVAATSTGCTYTVVTQVSVRDPARIAVRAPADRGGGELLAAGMREERAALPAEAGDVTRLVVDRSATGELRLGCAGPHAADQTPIFQDHGMAAVQPSQFLPQREVLSTREESLVLTTPLYAACTFRSAKHEGDVELWTHWSNVVNVERRRVAPRESVLFLPLGVAMLAGGALGVGYGLSKSGLDSGTRAGTEILSTVAATGGVLILAIALHGLFAHDQKQILDLRSLHSTPGAAGPTPNPEASP
jgi:hypothetical protein